MRIQEKKKKKTQTRFDVRATASDAGAAPLVPRPCFLADDYTFPSLLKACASSKALQEVKQLHCLATKLGLSHNIYLCPTLIICILSAMM